ncbi:MULTISPECIES: DEAD/DEAH box helicase family protein [Clostridium]|uniref:Type III restriction protein, res subunit n=1 Tax=Clostridium disporicum TaxID=84024 RepID=A0A174C1X1_9CLOT|nr:MULTISPECIES: DEAD/DEAH box helicase family protein [Clostridium]CUO07124.1 type III restriction protein%2C res subunit [Clostridium disporicum]
MSNSIRLKDKVISVKEKTIQEEQINLNTSTGDKDHLYPKLKQSFKTATTIDIIVSFLMESGVKLLLQDLKEALDRGVKIRILTGNYLKITQPQALYLLKSELGDTVDLRFYNNPNKSFHPKAYMFHNPLDSEIYIGSSNISRGALTSSIEWNYRFLKSNAPNDFKVFYDTFEDLFNNHSLVITDEVLKDYSKQWTRPNIYKDLEKEESKEDKVVNIFEPRGAQIEALYSLDKSREEGFDKGLVVAATGIGKTYLAAFDSAKYQRILFVAHREEIIKQAAQSFKNVRNSDDIGFFYANQKDTNNSFIFALVQTLGKDEYLNEKYFARDYFDYIVVDEFHHAVSNNYNKIINYFTPKFLLGLTATPERLDSKDVFALCDYNMVYEVRLKDAINKGWLVPFKYYGIYDETVNYEDIDYKYGKYDDKQLEEALMLNKRGELILNHYQKYNSQRAMGFCSSRHHAEYMAKVFNENKVSAAAVYSGERGEYSEERDIALAKLTSGELKVIFSVDMFNEGLDVPQIDMVMFLRPTQSPTIFLQQLGRGLRKAKDKKCLNVLDFIGNYKKANLVPFLLSGKEYSAAECKKNKQGDYEFPEECIVDFDFRIIDIFKKQAEREMKVKDKIKEQFDIVSDMLGHRPSRVELFTYMDDNVYQNIRSKNKSMDPFKNYLEYIKENDELSYDEEKLYNSRGREFINMIETTSMSKTYKMPVLLAFYNDGDIKMEISEDDIYKSFYDFYRKGSNKVDMLKDKSTSDFMSWDKKKYISLAKNNPIKFLIKTHGDFFKEKDNCILALQDDLKELISSKAFKEHMLDAIDLRVETYYKNRFFNKRK